MMGLLLLMGAPATQLHSYHPVRSRGHNNLGWAATIDGKTRRGRVTELGAACCLMPGRKCFQGLQGTKQTRAERKSFGVRSSLLPLDKKFDGERVLRPSPTTTHDYLQCLPGMEPGSLLESGSTAGAPLLYKPYMDHLWRTLFKAAPGFRSLDLELDFMRQTSNVGAKTSRIFNWLACSSRLRRIRMTYFDGGSALQAFNSLLYPDFRYDVPMLGIDLLSFGNSKILCVVDFTPLTQDPAYLDKYTSQIAPFRAKMAPHCGKMTTKFYDENQFFSKQLIFYRSDLGGKDPLLQVPSGLLFTTYVDYVDQYLQILHGAEADEDPLHMSYVASRQNEYNKHSEERDPAIKIFNKHFGEEWSERFTREFLFRQTP